MRIIRIAAPVDVVETREVKMLSPTQWAFNIKLDKNGSYGPAIIVTLEPNLASERTIDVNRDINLNMREKSLLVRAMKEAAKKANVILEPEVQDNDLQYEFEVTSAAYAKHQKDRKNMTPFEENQAWKAGTEGGWVNTQEEIQRGVLAAKSVKATLSQLGFVFDSTINFF